ncbi:MAG: nitrilase-related carbon-nitrogen hydrolase [Rhizomicrobium sp.]
MTAFRAACVQLRSSDDVAENIRVTSEFIREAKGQGAQFIATPENTTLMAPDGGAKLASSYDEAHDPALPAFRALAEELGIWLLIGSLAIKVSDTKTANRQFFIDPKGRIAARYSKIHLFDVDLPSGEKYRESNTVAGGDEAVLADTPWGRIGLTICYDMRFRSSIARWRRKAPLCSPRPRPSPRPPAGRIGTSCCAPAPSRTAPSCWRPPRAAPTPMAARPMATRSSSRPGARYWRRPAPSPASSSPTSIPPPSRRRAPACRTCSTTAPSKARDAPRSIEPAPLRTKYDRATRPGAWLMPAFLPSRRRR